ncbi:hypothetical protein Y032_0005g2656 [Ancylostoma ceylanicum]|uniref:GRIP domain-containing protein n=2 Tax=Ancylostoma ceylanicum TaxID=53326 RepID=A0A016VSR7_9BILA|nr:hypothetical protein Y032_0005g2656 [Ancylostoma ceylanicum]
MPRRLVGTPDNSRKSPNEILICPEADLYFYEYMSWLRNLQGQLSELASEVLSEATDEVADPESELQVAKKKLAEAERLLIIEQSKVTALEEKVNEQEQQLSAYQVDIDMVTEQHKTMILARDEEIKKLKTEVERSQLGGWRSSDVDTGSLEQTVMDLQHEVSHWKSLVEADSKKISCAELEKRLEEERLKKEEEIASLVELHTRNMNEMKEMYEERICALEGVASSSTSNTDLLDAVLLEKEELLETKRKLEEMVKQRESACPSTADASVSAADDRLVVVDFVERSPADVTDLEEKLREAQSVISQLRASTSELEAKVAESENLKIQHKELAQAYNDLNEEFEKYKEITVSNNQDNNNQDLTRRIDLLKANLIEYEERYEMCKRENLETVAQLERLSGEFERLKTGFADVRDQKDSDMCIEVDRLRVALEQAKQDRDRLRDDVDKFRSTIEGIDVELDLLRASNQRLSQENERMAAVIDRYNSTFDAVSAQREAGVGQEVSDAQPLAGKQSAAFENLNKELREEITMLQERNRLLSEESRLLAEVNAHMKKQEETDSRRTQLLEEKISLLEEHRGELQTSLRELQEKASQNQSNQSTSSTDEVSALTAQLREALAANAEKTEECEKLRQQTDDLEKEVTVRQSCIDEMIAQTNVLQVQLQLAAETNMQLKQQILEKDRSLNTLNEELSRKQPETAVSDGLNEPSAGEGTGNNDGQLLFPLQKCEENDPSVSTDSCGDVPSEQQHSRVECPEMKGSRSDQVLVELEEKLKEKEGVIESLIRENEQLRQVATQKHAESVDYFSRLESTVAQIAVLEQKILDNERQANEALANEQTSRDKLSRELQRLKEHLLLVEETSTTEAVEAEKRETELREQIRLLQNSVTAADSDVVRTTQTMKVELSALQERVVIAEESAEEWRCRFETEKRLRSETNDALASLQIVVRELSADHERESADASHKNMQLQSKIKELTTTVESMRAEMERLSLDKQTVEDLLESAKSAINSRQKIVEDLEVQLEELRASSRLSTESYRIDDATLRQLFLSYFTAPVDKRADIALLLASILEYSPEDMHKVRQAVSGTTSNRQRQSGSVSLAEQFIRFLESESESASTAPHLPVGPREATPGPSIAPPQLNPSTSQPNNLDAVLK